MTDDRTTTRALWTVPVMIAAMVLAGCAADTDPVARAEAQVSAKEKAATEAQAAFESASDEFCVAGESYIRALDVYGDILNATAATVGDVRAAGSDLTEPRDEAMARADAAADAHEDLLVAQRELVDAQAAMAAAQTPSGEASPSAGAPSASPLVPAASVERVEQAEADFDSAMSSISDDTLLTEAPERFNSAVVALELSWLRLFADAGCLSDEQQVQAEAAVRAYTTALQQDLTDAGYYDAAVDGIYGPLTVEAVEALQSASDLPVTGTVDRATATALDAELLAAGVTAAEESLASTAAVQQTLALAGYWDGPIDGQWTPELTAAVQSFQTALDVEPTGEVDAATIAAFEAALAELTAPDGGVSPTPSASADS